MEQNQVPLINELNAPTQPVLLPEQNKHGKNIFSKVILVLTITIGVIVVAAIISYLTGKNITNSTSNEVNETSPTQGQTANTDPFSALDEDWKDYNNKQYQFNFRYPESARLSEENPFSLDPSTYSVIFSRAATTETEENLTEGYVFKVTINKGLVNRDLAKIADERQKFYLTQCPPIAKAGPMESLKISGFNAQAMTVDNCNYDVKEIFVLKDELIYQLTIKYIGDLGYKQFYKTTAEEILKSFEITNLIAPNPTETWISFKREDVEFKHPSLSDTCCTISGPATVDNIKPRQLTVLADLGTVTTDNKPFNGFGLFMVDNIKSDNFIEYIEKQKASLIENYRIVIGKNPTTQDKKVIVDNIEAVLLEGYAWWGDLIFVPIEKTSRVLVISKSEVSPGAFDNLFGEIISTFSIEKLESSSAF